MTTREHTLSRKSLLEWFHQNQNLKNTSRFQRRLQKHFVRPSGNLRPLPEFQALLKDEDPIALRNLLLSKKTRSLSGVVTVTILTKPYPCPGECIFCPNDPQMPKSYLTREPGGQRGLRNHFSAYKQVRERLLQLQKQGHPIDKVEVIVLGGTWTSYTKRYQLTFITDVFRALNDGPSIEAELENTISNGETINSHIELPKFSPSVQNYNRSLKIIPRGRTTQSFNISRQSAVVLDEEALKVLCRQHDTNEHAGSRCVGLSIETRPDHVHSKTLTWLRRLGVTKVQIGAQHRDNTILEMNKRGHTLEDVQNAVFQLRSFGFKVQLHFMVNLLGATPEVDIHAYRALYTSSTHLHPDEVKLYPCTLVRGTELENHYAKGEWAPYEGQVLTRLLAACIESTPRRVRLSRIIRDISSNDILAGDLRSNLRELAEQELLQQGRTIEEIRHREVRDQRILTPTQNDSCEKNKAIVVHHTPVDTPKGKLVFIELKNSRDQIHGFARLWIPNGAIPSPLPELANAAILRELHVYGGVVSIGEKPNAHASQSRGLGASLIQECVHYIDGNTYTTSITKLSVISAIGTRGYYRSQGFIDGSLYQHLVLEK